MRKITIPKNHLLYAILENAFVQLEHTHLLLTPNLPPRLQEWNKTWSDVGEPLSFSQWEEALSLLVNPETNSLQKGNQKEERKTDSLLDRGFISLEDCPEEHLQNLSFCLKKEACSLNPTQQSSTLYFKAPLPLKKKGDSISGSIIPLKSKFSPALHFFVGPVGSGKSSLMLHRLQKTQ